MAASANLYALLAGTLALVACGNAPVQDDAHPAPTHTQSPHDPEPATSPTPTVAEPSHTEPSPSRSFEPPAGGAWTSIELPPSPATGSAHWMADGWDGGTFLVTGQRDPQGDPDYGIRLVAWHLAGDGTLDKRFAGDGSVTIGRTHSYAPLVIRGSGKAADGAMLVLTSAVDSGISGPMQVRRISRTGELNEAFTEPRPIDDDHNPKMTVLTDGSIRICRTIRGYGAPGYGNGPQAFTVGVWGYRGDGSPDPTVGPDGDRERAMTAHGTCAAIAATPDGGFVIAAAHGVDDPHRSGDRSELSLVGFHADATQAWTTPIRLGDDDEQYTPTDIAVAEDGSILVAGHHGSLNRDWFSRSFRGFIAKATPAGLWDGAFGNDGVVYLPQAQPKFPAFVEIATRGDAVVAATTQREQLPDGTYGGHLSWVVAHRASDGAVISDFEPMHFRHAVSDIGFDHTGSLTTWRSPGPRAILERHRWRP